MTFFVFRCPHCGHGITLQPDEPEEQALDFHLWVVCDAVPACGTEWDSGLQPGVRRRCTRYLGHPEGHWA